MSFCIPAVDSPSSLFKCSFEELPLCLASVNPSSLYAHGAEQGIDVSAEVEKASWKIN